MSNKILVTGAAGFLGSRLIRQLVEAGETVKALVQATSNLRVLGEFPADKVELIEGDVRVEHTIFRALAGCDRMYHVAATNKLWSPNPSEILDAAILGTQQTLSAAKKRGLRRVVCTSSVATLGTTSGADEMDETHEFNLRDPELYIEAKQRAETAALEFNSSLEVIVAMPSVMVGPGDIKPTPFGQGLLQFLTWSMPLMDFPIVDGGLSYVDVDDVARGHIALMEKGAPGERYILGGENLTYEQFFSLASELAGVAGPGGSVSPGLAAFAGTLAELWCKLGGPEPLISHKSARDYAGAYAWVTSAKAEKSVGYKHAPVRRALARNIQWFLENSYLRPEHAKRLRINLRAP